MMNKRYCCQDSLNLIQPFALKQSLYNKASILFSVLYNRKITCEIFEITCFPMEILDPLINEPIIQMSKQAVLSHIMKLM